LIDQAAGSIALEGIGVEPDHALMVDG